MPSIVKPADWQTGKILDCGSKRSATPLSPAGLFSKCQRVPCAQKRCRRCALPVQSKMAAVKAKRLGPKALAVGKTMLCLFVFLRP